MYLNTDMPELLVAIAGISILLWLFVNALRDLLPSGRHTRKPSHNILILCLTGIYIVKILFKEILQFN
jgi:hypothetical protein